MNHQYRPLAAKPLIYGETFKSSINMCLHGDATGESPPIYGNIMFFFVDHSSLNAKIIEHHKPSTKCRYCINGDT